MGGLWAGGYQLLAAEAAAQVPKYMKRVNILTDQHHHPQLFKSGLVGATDRSADY